MSAAKEVEITILECFEDPDRGAVSNPYTALLVHALQRDGISVRTFDWRFALMGQYDIIHAHWPEQLVRHPRRLRQLIKRGMAVALLLRLKVTRTPVVRTLHNIRPHEAGSPFEQWFLRAIDSQTRDWIVLTEVSETPTGAARHLIPHGHYRSWYTIDSAEPIAGRLLTFGLIRPYKGVETLIDEFHSISDESLHLQIVGSPSSDAMRDAILERVARDERVEADLRFASDAELASIISESEVVALPYPAMHNSGAVLLALSMHRPVIVADTPSTRLMEEEFGPAWIARLPRDWRGVDLAEAVERLRDLPRDTSGPDMASRDWAVVGDMHADVLRRRANANR